MNMVPNRRMDTRTRCLGDGDLNLFELAMVFMRSRINHFFTGRKRSLPLNDHPSPVLWFRVQSE
jgi:hypothetical protein